MGRGCGEGAAGAALVVREAGESAVRERREIDLGIWDRKDTARQAAWSATSANLLEGGNVPARLAMRWLRCAGGRDDDGLVRRRGSRPGCVRSRRRPEGGAGRGRLHQSKSKQEQ